MIPVLVDMDPGTDDALALMMLLKSPVVEVVGITTVGGNARLADTTRNTLRILEHLHRENIPVARGAARPRHRPFHYAYGVHGARGLGIPLPSPTTRPIKSRAPAFIAHMASRYRHHLTILGLGPLTNISRAIQREPRVIEWTKELIVMGGAISVAGNITPHAEFNTYNDPDAAHMVLSSNINTSLVGLDVTTMVSFERVRSRWFEGNDITTRLSDRILRSWFDSNLTSERYHLHDPLAVVAMLRPDLFSWRHASIDVETDDAIHLGKTTATYGAFPSQIASSVQADSAAAVVVNMLSSPEGQGVSGRDPAKPLLQVLQIS